MATVVLRNLAHDIIWALLALGTSLIILTPSLSALVTNTPFWPEAGGFLVITVLPSVLVWSVFGLKGLKFRVPAALCCQVIVTVLSMALFYLLNDARDISGSETRVALLGFGVFAGLKVLDFVVVKFCRACLGKGKRVLIVGEGLQAEFMEKFISGNRYSHPRIRISRPPTGNRTDCCAWPRISWPTRSSSPWLSGGAFFRWRNS